MWHRLGFLWSRLDIAWQFLLGSLTAVAQSRRRGPFGPTGLKADWGRHHDTTAFLSRHTKFTGLCCNNFALSASDVERSYFMVKVAIWATVQAKSGKEGQVESFLKSAQPLAEAEPATVSWYALNLGGGRFGI